MAVAVTMARIEFEVTSSGRKIDKKLVKFDADVNLAALQQRSLLLDFCEAFVGLVGQSRSRPADDAVSKSNKFCNPPSPKGQENSIKSSRQG